MHRLTSRVLSAGLIGTLAFGVPAQAADEASQQDLATSMEAAAAQMQKAFAGLAQAAATGMQAAPGEVQAAPAIQTVNFRELKKILAKRLGDLELVSSSGETTKSMGFAVSQAEGQYRSADGEMVKVEVRDLGTLKGFGQMANAWHVEVDRESDTEYERTYDWRGRRARKSYNSQTKRGEFGAMAGEGRFMVEFSGYTADRQLAAWEQAASEMDFKTLDGWKDFGTTPAP